MPRWLKLPIRRFAVPTPNGLKLKARGDKEPVMPADFFPWSRLDCLVSSQGTSYFVLDEHGERMLLNDRQVVLHFNGKRAQRTASRARQRWLRREWLAGRLAIEESYGPSRERWTLLILPALLLFVAIGGLKLLIIPAWRFNDPLMPQIFWWFIRFMALFFGFIFIGPILAWGMWVVREWNRPQLSRLRIDARSLQIKFRNEEAFEANWRDLREVRWYPGMLLRLSFGGTQEVLIGGLRPQAQEIIRLIHHATFPEKLAAGERSWRWMKLRIVLYLLIGCVLAGVLIIHSVAPEDRWDMTGRVVLAFVLLPLGSWVYLKLSLNSNKFRRWLIGIRRALRTARTRV